MKDKPAYRKLEKRLARLRQELHRLRRSRLSDEANFRLAVEHANEAIVATREGRFVYVNPKAVQISGYSRRTLIRRPFIQFIHPDDRRKVMERQVQRSAPGAPAEPYLLRLIDRHGRIKWLENHSVLVDWDARPAVLSFLTDVTMRQQIQDRIHTLSQQLIRAQENERQKISRYLHDNVAQDLSSLLIAGKTLFDDAPGIPDAVRQKMARLSAVLHRCINAVRDLAYDLRPPVMEQLGLVPAIYQYCEEFARQSGIRADFSPAGMDNLNLETEIEINLYRLVQEALNNIRTHAGASQVSVKLIASSPNLILRIEDDGRGFDVEEQLQKSAETRRMGLGGMVERVSLLKGKLTIESRQNRGTKIFAEVPVRKRKTTG